MNEPNIINSSKAQRLIVEQQSVSIDIYKLEGGTDWSLEVINEEGTSVVWDDLFSSDEDALTMALETLDKEGLRIFFDKDQSSNGDNVIPFNRDD